MVLSLSDKFPKETSAIDLSRMNLPSTSSRVALHDKDQASHIRNLNPSGESKDFERL